MYAIEPHVTIGSWPFLVLLIRRLCARGSSPYKPMSKFCGRLSPLSRAVISAQARILTKYRIAASRRVDCLCKIALLTLSAASRRRSGSSRAANWGSRVSIGNNKRAIVFSRSSKNFGFVGALGPNCSVANFKAGPMSSPSVLQDRMSSTRWRRSREKWSALSSSRIYFNLLGKSDKSGSIHSLENRRVKVHIKVVVVSSKARKLVLSVVHVNSSIIILQLYIIFKNE